MSLDFVNVNSEFEKEFKSKLDSRYFTFKTALNILNQLKSVSILETGCVRMADDYGAGNSTYLFAYYLQNYAPANSILTTVDISELNIATCNNLILPHFPYNSNRFKFNPVISDSLEFLRTALDNHQKYDLIYLDSLDANLENAPICREAQQHQLSEAKLAVQLFNPEDEFKILLLDDNNLPFGGKTTLTKAFLYEQAWTCLIDYQQSLWIKTNV